MSKKPMTTSPLPVPPLAPALTPDSAQVSAVIEAIAAPNEKAAEALTETGVESVTLITQPSPSMKATPRLVRLIPTHGFPIRHFNGGIVFYPNQPSAEVPVDAWLENQMRRGILKEV
jgi:hypothetical protein